MGLKGIVGVLVSAVLIWWTLRGVSIPEVWAVLRGGNLWLLGASVLVATAGFLLRALRWRVLLEPLKPNTSLDSRFGAITIGFMANNLLPARVGEILRAYAFSRMEAVPMSGALGSLAVERILDGIVLFVFLLLPLTLPGFAEQGGASEVGGMVGGLVVVMGVMLAVLAVLLIWPARVVGLGERLVRRLPAKAARATVAALGSFLEALQVMRNLRLLTKAVLWSFLFWSWHGISFYLGMAAFGIDEGFGAAIFTEAAVGFGVALPSAPGFFGTFHAAAAWALEGVYGVDAARSLAFAYGYHLGGFIPVTLIGLWYARRMGLSLGDLRGGGRPAEGGEQDGDALPSGKGGAAAAARVAADPAAGFTHITVMPGGRTVTLPESGAVETLAPAKVNLFLRVLEREPSGYHRIETLFQMVALADRLHLEVSDERGVLLDVTGMDAGPPAQNLVRRAAEAYLRAAALPLGVRIHLEKRIPAGAGLGGGSSDAASTLRGLDLLFGGALPTGRLGELAATLGSDVPFFLCGSALATGEGRGERLTPLPPLPQASVILALPEVHASTAAAYRAIDRLRQEGDAPERSTGTIPREVHGWQEVARLAENDFEAVVLQGNLLIARARDALAATDPQFTLLSGSGSAVYALYPDAAAAERAHARLSALEGVRFLLTHTLTHVPEARTSSAHAPVPVSAGMDPRG